jgi:solute carrier family 25 carnitine/acylcarnitine transporter 20/29
MESFNDELIATTKDLVAGIIGGSAGILVGQPLDTIRVYLQSAQNNHFRTSKQVFFHIIKHEGVKSLMKGTVPHVLGQIPHNAIVFGSF